MLLSEMQLASDRVSSDSKRCTVSSFQLFSFKTEEASRGEMQLRFGASAQAAADPFAADPFAEAQAR